MYQIEEKLKLLKYRFQNLKKKINIISLKEKQKTLIKESSNKDFWSRSDAVEIMKELDVINNNIKILEDFEIKLLYIMDLIKLSYNSKDNISNELQKDIIPLENLLDEIELYTYLNGKFDHNDAIFSIHAGQGGTEACDWAQILERMYLKYFESKGWKAVNTNRIAGQDAGISTVSMEVSGINVYGFLKKENGAHRLVRISPFNAQRLRQTSFAGVEVAPIIENNLDIIIKDEDIDFYAVRSGGAGGQNVNKVATAARITHIPTGITVTCSTERSQLANKKYALNLLKAKLYLLEEAKYKNNLKNEKGEYKIAGWGNQVRNYILNPYKLVKDVRTQIETSDIESVLNGDLDIFINAEIRL